MSTATDLSTRISWVKPDGPAALAGVLKGDVLMQIDGRDSIDLSNAQIASAIQAAGLEIRLLCATTTAATAAQQSRKIATMAMLAASPAKPAAARDEQTSDLNNIFAGTTTLSKSDHLLAAAGAAAARAIAADGPKDAKAAAAGTGKGKRATSKRRVSTSLFQAKGSEAHAPTSATAVRAAKAKIAIGAAAATAASGDSRSKNWSAAKTSRRGTFSEPSALSRGSEYVDKPPKMKAFWEKDAASAGPEGGKKGGRKGRPGSAGYMKALGGVTAKPGLKAFIKEQRTASRVTRTRERTASSSAAPDAGLASEGEGDALASSRRPSPGTSDTAAGNMPLRSSDELVSPDADAMLIQLQKERDESRKERDDLVRQVVSLTDNYEDLVTGKEEEIERLLGAADEQRRLLVERSAAADDHRDASQSTQSEMRELAKLREELVYALETSTSDNEKLVAENKELRQKGQLAGTRLNRALAAREASNCEIGELRAIVRTTEDALAAKDSVHRIKLHARTDEVLELRELLEAADVSGKDAANVILRRENEAMQQKLSRVQSEADANTRAAVALKQDEMTLALKQLRKAFEQSPKPGAEKTAAVAEAEELRNALLQQELGKQKAIAALEQDKLEFVQHKQAEVQHAMERKDIELARALDLAQREVDRLLEEKQEEVDELLDEKDSTIASLVADLKEANVRARLSLSSTSGGVGDESFGSGDSEDDRRYSVVTELRELVDMKNSLLLSKEHDMEDLRLRHEDEIEQLLAEEDDRVDEQVAAREAEMQEVIDQMETALTEAMSAKGDLLCLDEKANQIIFAERMGGMEGCSPDGDRKGPGALQRVERALANSDSTINNEVVRLKLQIARLTNNPVEAEAALAAGEPLPSSVEDDTLASLQKENLSLFEELEELRANGTVTAALASAAATGYDTHATEELEKLRAELAKEKAVSAAEAGATVAQELEKLRVGLAREKAASVEASRAQIAGLEVEVARLSDELAAARAQHSASESAADTSAAQVRELKGMVARADEALAETTGKLQKFDGQRKKLLNQIMDLKGNARVFCRVRPLLPSEAALEQSHVHLIDGADTGTITLVDPSGKDVKGVLKTKKYDFEFNHVFGPESSQAAVYHEVDQLVHCALCGFNVVIFAYGQTGSGKTHTMTGEPTAELEGIIPRAVRGLFDELDNLSQRDWVYTLSASFLEIYNESIRDLLVDDEAVPPDSESKRYEIKQDKKGCMYVTSLTVRDVTTPAEIAALLESASRNRAVGVSDMNDRSSRSHSICQLVLRGKNGVTGATIASKINLVDLAGSERLSSPALVIDAAPMDHRARLSAEYALRQKETLSINKSLSNLANVVQAIQTRSLHVPYRNSKLTYLLKDALGGDSKSLMLVNISPREDCRSESLCSLRFAAKVNNTSFGHAGKASPTKDSRMQVGS